MKVAVILKAVSKQVWSDSSLDVLPPIDPYYVTGPRGGRYLAVPPWTRTVDETTRWDQNLVTVIDRSAGLRYIRPHLKGDTNGG